MISFDKKEKINTAQILTATVFYPVQFAVHQTQKIRNIWSENKKLREGVMRLKLKNSALQEKTMENKRLRRLLNFKKTTDFDLIPAEVVAQNPERGMLVFILNVGKSDGIEKNMPVVGIDGVVGKTVAVSQFLCHVQLLSDPNCRISVMTQRSRVAGILESENGIRFKMRTQEYADVKKGDKIISSGFGGIFPKGLNVGTISGIKMDKHKIFKVLYIKIQVDFDYVEEVFVLKRKSLWRSDTTSLSVTDLNR